MKKKSLQVYLDDYERSLLDVFSRNWGCSLSAALKRILREKQEDIENQKGK